MFRATAPAERAVSNRLRVLVVDDSFVARELISRWIGATPGLEVVGMAASGRQALGLVQALRPDVVLLDLEMPDIDGVTVLPQLLAARPGLLVLVVSTLSQRNAELSLTCLSLGAVDFVPKPLARGVATGASEFRREILAKLSGLQQRSAPIPSPAQRIALASAGRRPSPASIRAKPRVVVIGASTGGPSAMMGLVRGLTRVSQQAPILILQHMPALFTSVFARHIEAEAGLPCAEAVDGEPIRPRRVYVAPGGRHMGLAAAEGGPLVRLTDGPAVQHCRPSLDVLLADAARVFGSSCLAVVLTGMGCDGTQGARAIVEAGGTVLAQDEATSAVWGMPGSIVRAGLARQVLPIGAMADAIDGLVTQRR